MRCAFGLARQRSKRITEHTFFVLRALRVLFGRSRFEIIRWKYLLFFCYFLSLRVQKKKKNQNLFENRYYYYFFFNQQIIVLETTFQQGLGACDIFSNDTAYHMIFITHHLVSCYNLHNTRYDIKIVIKPSFVFSSLVY